MSEVYFFDTYAIIEIFKGNPDYAKFQEVRIVTTIFNLVELHYILLRDFNKKIADTLLEKYAPYTIGIDLEVIKKASEFKLKHKRNNFSGTDAIGYMTSLKNGIKFLTGDDGFRGFENVEFVK